MAIVTAIARLIQPRVIALGGAISIVAGYMGRGGCTVPYSPFEIFGVF